MTETETQTTSLVGLTADIASAYVGSNLVPASDLPGLIKSIHGALTGAGAELEQPGEPPTPAVSIKKSVTPNYLICLEDGRQFKSMKRHLRTHFGLTPQDYRAKWGLPSSYPMVAPAYAATRSNLAKKTGLGQKGRSAPRAAPEKRARTA
jgi:predicted transcriptional regulator